MILEILAGWPNEKKAATKRRTCGFSMLYAFFTVQPPIPPPAFLPEVIDYQTGNAGGDGGHHGHAHDRGRVPGAAVKADGVTVDIHHDAAAAEDQRKGAEDDDEPVLALVVLPFVLKPGCVSSSSFRCSCGSSGSMPK